MGGVTTSCPIRVLACARLGGVGFLDLVDYHSICINCWTQYQISSLSLDLNVSVRSDLTKSSRRPDSKHRLPSILPSQTMIQLIIKLQAHRPRTVVRVVIKRAATFLRQIAQISKVLILLVLVSVRKDEQVACYLCVRQLRGRVREIRI